MEALASDDRQGGCDLARCALLMACEEYPGLDVDAYLACLDGIAASVQAAMPDGADGRERLAALNQVLFGTLDFQGNRADYYSAENSYLNLVLDRRTGIPITLSLVYLEVGNRLGLDACGIGLPGHFLVRLRLEDTDDVYVDPFHEGRLLDRKEAVQLASTFLPEGTAPDEAWLEPVAPRAFLARMLRNLKAIYSQESDMERLRWVCELLVDVCPDQPIEVRDRGLVYFSLKCYGLAAADLQQYLLLETEDEERQRIEEIYKQARQLHALMN